MNVFQELGQAFRQAVENFKTELHRDRIPESVDELLRGMRQELVDARSDLRKLEKEIRRTLERAAKEEEEAATCRRREKLALKIEDEETAGVARQFGERHEKRQAILERKALALKEELDLRRSEIDEMRGCIEEAHRKRDALAAQKGRVEARETVRDASDLFSELDRMADRIRDEERRTRSAIDLEEELDPDQDPERGEVGFQARLDELKRRMREEGGA